ncbi:hypothetical protein FOXB_08980 [Fusarium oxysporum f. sp. conglutinans Fo5176]|uniref:Uncharacterized protein n=1 Tax=Fusarium oxysporum (strain Fo5176) TaxID=660025 RepID=F9FRF0_FUSOF|nr:hypothetical protein FOXB_08980 [Fusarium oxysporum f. sp. conglutinans Fo5176]
MALHQDILPIPSPSMLYHGDQYQNTASLLQPELECQAVFETFNSAGPRVLCSAFRAQKVPGTRLSLLCLGWQRSLGDSWSLLRILRYSLCRLDLSQGRVLTASTWLRACPKAQCQDVVEHFSPLRTTGLWISNVS